MSQTTVPLLPRCRITSCASLLLLLLLSTVVPDLGNKHDSQIDHLLVSVHVGRKTRKPRKILKDKDRKAICQYAEDHPHAAQAMIGIEFEVERSAVSKVLRDKEKYLNSDTNAGTTTSPIKPIKKNGGASIERALINFLRNARKSGIPVTDADIMEKARRFSAITNNSDDILSTVSRVGWLQKLRKKSGSSGRLIRRDSETSLSSSICHSLSLTASQSNSGISLPPTSVYPSPSPLSAKDSEDTAVGKNNYPGFNTEPRFYSTPTPNPPRPYSPLTPTMVIHPFFRTTA